MENYSLESLPEPDARQRRITRILLFFWLALGIILAASGTRDIVDAHVVLCARRAKQPIMTSDPDDLRRLDSKARLIEV